MILFMSYPPFQGVFLRILLCMACLNINISYREPFKYSINNKFSKSNAKCVSFLRMIFFFDNQQLFITD
jgi:hypothetical protein